MNRSRGEFETPLFTGQEEEYSEARGPENRGMQPAHRGKVAVLTSVHAITDHRVFHKECRTLAQSGYEVVLILPHDRDERLDGVRIRAIARPKGRRERMSLTVWRIYKAALEENADIYHLHDPELLPVGLLLKMAAKHVVYDAHEDVPKDILIKEYIPLPSRRLLSWAASFVEKGAASKLDGIIVASDHMLAGFRRSRLAVSVRNYPLLHSFAGHEDEHLRDGTLKLIYTGSVRPVRGITQVVDAMDLLPPEVKASLLLCGPFSPESYSEELALRKGFSKVHYGGIVDFTDIPRHLARADVGVALLQPTDTYQDAIPTKLFEYLAAGLPVITSAFPLYKRIIERYGCGLCVDPTDPSAIASAIEHLFKHPEQRAAMSSNARRAGLEYSWSTESRKLLSLYQDILESK